MQRRTPNTDININMPDSTPKRIVLVGHCGPDGSYLRMTVGKAVKGASILIADDESDLNRFVAEGVDLVLLNRVLDYGFGVNLGTELIKRLRQDHPNLKTMLVTNYPDVQAEAIRLGALPGFGKREMGSPKVTDLLRQALAEHCNK
jgi:two-component system, chemotaxis family, chemotaxis protein CheY